MRWRLKELIAEHTLATGAQLTYEEITAATGLSSNTLSTIATNKARRADLETVDRLLSLFSEKLGRQLSTNDLLRFTPEN